MRIAHIVSSFPPYFGGMGNVVYQTAAELEKKGHEVVVFTVGYQQDMLAEEGNELEKHISDVRRLWPSFQYGNAARLPQIQKELDDFDIVHFHYPFFGTANLIRKWKLKNPNKPLVITYHMDPKGDGWLGLVFKMYANFYSHKILSIGDKIIASSLDYVESSQASQIMKTNQNKWVGLPFGVDIERFKPMNKQMALFSRHKLDPKKPVLLFVGGMDSPHYFKGVPILLKALLLLKRQEMEIQTVLVGDGDLREEFEMKAAGYGLARFVKFAGHVSNEELPYYYSMADLLVLPSIHQGEAFGMVLLEAMASGVPVLASDLPGVRTVAADGGMVFKTSDYVQLAESLAGYFSLNISDMQIWKENVRRVAEEKYSWPVIVDKLENIYRELV